MKHCNRFPICLVLLFGLPGPLVAGPKSKTPQAAPTALDRYIEEASQSPVGGPEPSQSGSLWTPAANFGDLAGDLRASRVNDIVTVLVLEQASASATGATKTSRASSANSSVTALAGQLSATSRLANLANLGSNTKLDGQGTTSRQTVLSTTLTARVAHVMPNGNLIIEGVKNIVVNSENQTIRIRGIVRPADLTTDNIVRSDHLGQMEVNVNGKGVVNDNIRRPFFLYRLLLGLLPF